MPPIPAPMTAILVVRRISQAPSPVLQTDWILRPGRDALQSRLARVATARLHP